MATFHDAGFDASQSARLLQVISGMILGPALHRAAWAAAVRDRPPEPTAGRASVAPSAEEFRHSKATEQFTDWSAGPKADLLTLELLVGGLEALADQSS